jgi:hypothetical protein
MAFHGRFAPWSATSLHRSNTMPATPWTIERMSQFPRKNPEETPAPHP